MGMPILTVVWEILLVFIVWRPNARGLPVAGQTI